MPDAKGRNIKKRVLYHVGPLATSINACAVSSGDRDGPAGMLPHMVLLPRNDVVTASVTTTGKERIAP